MPRKLVHIGGLLGAFGLATGALSVVTPWTAAGVVILNIKGGVWYVLLLFTLVALLGTAALGTGLGRRVAGLSGPILSLATAALIVGLITTVEAWGSVAGGGWLALASMPLLGFACGLIAIGRV
ncbi:hypothetical protein ABZS66_18475 [Dactylosporangium sp. NPDC005572]|uniref:hypothetical protein n=1 Tax=Dactylosporangium sp. NPDC005572 TaxID=3156889 RepID=UPI0033B4CCFC